MGVNLRNVKNILFDLGNVLIDIDPYLTIQEIENYGGVSWNESSEREALEQWLHAFERGQITPLNFCQHLCNILDLEISFEEFVEVWNKTLLEIPEERWSLIRELSEHYNLYLLSNTNEVHIRTIFYMYKRVYGQENLFEFMNKEYYSNLIGMRKPDRQIFEYVLNDSGIKANETIFIDDSRRNILAASELGFQTYLIGVNEEVSDIFN